ncbi:MAG: zinc-dependent alcohol dehydrogenase family protein [candidate division WOR-3 bacterium]
MRAMVLRKIAPVETAPLEASELPVPEPGPDELRVRVLACGVCHTDIHEIEGDIKVPRLPLIVGHEIVGIVDKLGENVSQPPPGTLVGIPWLAGVCRTCQHCRKGRENLCENIRFTGFHTDGGYAEFTLVRAGFCYPLPRKIPVPNLAPLLCAGVIGYRSLRRAQIQPGDRVGLWGFGASAHICLQILKYWRCPVAVFTRSPLHQQHARELGAEWVGSADGQPPFTLDAGVIFAPAGELVPKALARLERGATLALAGIHMSPIPVLDYGLIYHERQLVSVANSTRQDVIELLRLAEEVPLQTTVTTFPLEQANEALLAVKHSRINGAAVLIPAGV